MRTSSSISATSSYSPHPFSSPSSNPIGAAGGGGYTTMAEQQSQHQYQQSLYQQRQRAQRAPSPAPSFIPPSSSFTPAAMPAAAWNGGGGGGGGAPMPLAVPSGGDTGHYTDQGLPIKFYGSSPSLPPSHIPMSSPCDTSGREKEVNLMGSEQ